MSLARLAATTLAVVVLTACGGDADSTEELPDTGAAEAASASAEMPSTEAPSAQAAETQYSSGEASFTFDGQPRAWRLIQGRFQRIVEEDLPTREIVSLDYGTAEAGGDGQLVLLISRMGDAAWSVGELGVARSSRGVRYPPGSPRCDVTVSELSETTVRGTVSCPGQFDGPPIGAVTFSASR